MSIAFFIESFLLGIGLAMDSFSSSAVNGLNEPGMSRRKELLIAGTFGVFQGLMPLIGWFCVHVIAEAFEEFRRFTPLIALILLLYIGGKMIYDSCCDNSPEIKLSDSLDLKELVFLSAATSIDALAAGVTLAFLNINVIASSLSI